MTEYIKCEDCPLNKYHYLLREADPSIIGCNYFLVNGDLGLTRIVHKASCKTQRG